MKKTANSSVRYFHLDVLNRKICGSKNAFNAADKGYGDAYDQLMAFMAKHPDFELFVVSQKRRTEKAKETYKGMDIPWMFAYLEMKGDENAALKLEKVIAFAKNQNKTPYPLAKKYFFKPYTDKDGVIHFDYANAKAEVEAYLISKTEVAKKTTSTKEILALPPHTADNAA